MFVVSVVLLGRGLCDELITRPEESYRLWCVVVCDLENLVNDPRRVAAPQQKKMVHNVCQLAELNKSLQRQISCLCF